MGVIKLLWFEAEGYVCFETQGQGERMLTDRSTYKRRIGQTDANILGYEML
jgi:hypothetical protein